MPKAKNTEDKTQSVEAPNKVQNTGSEVETEAKTNEAEEAQSKMSRRDALEAAFKQVSEKVEPQAAEIDRSEEKVAAENTQKTQEQTPLKAPAEWTAEEKADFEASSRKQQEAALRLHHSRHKTIEEIKTEKERLKAEKNENEKYRQLRDRIVPFAKNRGGEENIDQRLIDALDIINDLDKAPKKTVAAILKAKGIETPKELLDDADLTTNQIDSLRSQVNSLITEREQEKAQAQVQILGRAFSDFEQAKNAAGSSKFPDVNESETGLRLASNIGSLVSGKTELSKQFIASVQSRIPNLSYTRLLEEAYRYLGGKVDDSTARPEDTQAHLKKSNRAASSVPAGGRASSVSGPIKKFKSRRDATAAALAEIREREGR